MLCRVIPSSSTSHTHSPLPLHTFTTSCRTLIHPPRALTKQSLAVSLSHQALATATPLFLFTSPSSRLGFHLLVFAALVSGALCLSAHPSSFLSRPLYYLAGLFGSLVRSLARARFSFSLPSFDPPLDPLLERVLEREGQRGS